jgi:TctA family transporter
MLSDKPIESFFTRPISLVFILITIAIFIYPIVKNFSLCRREG